jgi:hypothetical protein
MNDGSSLPIHPVAGVEEGTSWMRYFSYRNLLLLWGFLSVLCVAGYVSSLYTHIGTTFFAMMSSINILLLILAFLFRGAITGFLGALTADFERVNVKSAGACFQAGYFHERTWAALLVLTALLMGAYIIFLSVTDIQLYVYLWQEDGLIEYGSAILWFLAAIVLFVSIGQIWSNRNHNFSLLPYIGLVMFFIVCGGEEISWGQRILDVRTPTIMRTVNIQNELTIHNLGSISVFSNTFFLLTLIFFFGLPFLTRKCSQLKQYLHYYLFPLPHRSVIYVFLIGLLIWLFIGIRFGTLGFHPFSFFAEKYNTQMDDEIFELFAAYSFFAFSVMENRKRINPVES